MDQFLPKGIKKNGGSVIFMSEKSIKSTENLVVDVSGQNKGGEIRSLAKTINRSTGS